MMKGDFTPSVLHTQDSKIAGRAKQRPYRLASVKMPYDHTIQGTFMHRWWDVNYSVRRHKNVYL